MSKYEFAVERIASQALKGRLAMFLGSGFSTSLVSYMPGWEDLVRKVCEVLGENYDALSLDRKERSRPPQNVLSILPFAHSFRECGSADSYASCGREQIREIVRDHITEVTPGEGVHIHLLEAYTELMDKINPRIVFTTNFDDVTHRPFRESHKVLPRCDYQATAGTPVVHIHGHVSQPSSLVLFEEDYLHFQSEAHYLHNLLYCSLVENTTLVLGYSLNDPNIRQILYDMQRKENSDSYGRMYMVVRDEYLPHDVRLFESTYNTHVVRQSDIQAFLQDIVSAMERIAGLENRANDVAGVFDELIAGDSVKSAVENEDLFTQLIDGFARSPVVESEERVDYICRVLAEIQNACGENGAFAQYRHLARYLMVIGRKLVLDEGSERLREMYLEMFKFVLSYSGDGLGHSWAAGRFLRQTFNMQLSRNIQILKNDVSIRRDLARLQIVS